MQTALVIITFCLAAGFLLKKFVWGHIAEPKRSSSDAMKGDSRSCGNSGCGC